MANWTTGEIRLMKSLHESGISRAEFHAKFPRHTAGAVDQAATKSCVWLKAAKHSGRETPHQRRMRQAREYFARREQGLLT